MRFPADALAELRKIDPDTPVSLSFIRRLSRPVLCRPFRWARASGRLVNFDALIEFLSNPPTEAAANGARDSAGGRAGAVVMVGENFIIIPESIYRDERLSPRAVLLYGLVLSLSQNGFCWANNRFFVERLGVSKDRVSAYCQRACRMRVRAPITRP